MTNEEIARKQAAYIAEDKIITRIIQAEEDLDVLHNELKAHLGAPMTENSEQYRWLSIGRTHYQQATMAYTRAIANPNKGV